ncbi:pre-rRNA-processing protein IPI1 [Geosmithia morbida]|uniref:Pre-rRNA-processing protein n=1 Tax=Geosmithia morbida TaxID=1094350 RepID=A0A9P5D384_9HYPO|nr:pre-rRNA-processing protein IPI1 [Geosmithia morbida]KAF4124652.1 pre-rRNA-processing protein IPI1 [Geosmithia morbida]
MGSSTRKKKEKQQDFQKPKFKVGKAKAKASNFTDTSFKSRAIVMGHQSLSATAPDVAQQFRHSLSLASSSKSDKQRQEGLAHLINQLSSEPPVNPVGTHALLTKLLPLVADSSTPVRGNLLKLFRLLPADQVRYDVEQAAMFVRAGMTHLSADVSNDAIGFLDWLLAAAGEDLVSCPGGWVKTLNTFCAILGWAVSAGKDGWSSGGRSMGSNRSKASSAQARTIDSLTTFLRAGFLVEEEPASDGDEVWKQLYMVPRDPNAFAYLNLTGQRRDEDGEMYADRESRQRVFHRRFYGPISKGATALKKEGGAPGRATTVLDQLLHSPQGMGDYEPQGAVDTEDLLSLW